MKAVKTPPRVALIQFLAAHDELIDELGDTRNGELCEVAGRLCSQLAGPRASWPKWVQTMATAAAKECDRLGQLELAKACIETELERLRAK